MASLKFLPRSLRLGQTVCPSRGLTLPELLLTLVLLAVLSMAAWPSVRDWVARQRVEAAAQQMVAALQRARIEGLRRDGGVVLARLTPPDCASMALSDWSCGWVLFVDDDGDRRWSPGELALQHFPLQDQTQVRRSVNAGSVSVNRWGQWVGLVFSFTFVPPSGDLASSIQLCGSSGGRLRKITGATRCDAA
ncbi:GspH/FimT family protein [Curvibacter sp. HBC61]|uniref:Type II secretion system protein H n=1 Tax=Curvibacter cyanobacteriorum TaxID=3026422 RepID=A0ABT5MSM3_9BURK|nr:GspH/FimT family protein [Curvibacter sp. HBC61]MDD0837044.1 GspH/FimT family protein [Curvibacter sp. HBC61]